MENAKLYAALIKAKEKFDYNRKSKPNPHYKSKYATLQDMQESTKEGLKENELGIVQLLKNREDGNMLLITRLFHSSGENVESEYLIVRGGKDDQKIGASITYARRYSYGAILCLADDELDDDGNSTKDIHEPVQPRSAVPQVLYEKRLAEHVNDEPLLTEKQAALITNLVDRNRDEAKRVFAEFGIEAITKIPRTMASQVIDRLKPITQG